jgi:alkylation response protein AidB-like acyl-CoA dehydrogenase
MTHTVDPHSLLASDLQFSDEQRMVRETFAHFFEHEATPARVREADQTRGFDAALWQAYCAMGGDGLAVPAESGGGGGGLLDAALVGLECGRRLAPVPFAETTSAARLLARSVPGRTPVDGTVRVVADRSGPEPVWIPAGAVAHEIVWLDGQRLNVHPVSQPPGGESPAPILGYLPAVRLPRPTTPPTVSVPIDDAVRASWTHERRVLAGAVLVGAGAQALANCLEHVATRHQFGRPIGSFQAVQHRLADRVTELAGAELTVLRAARELGARPAADRYLSAAALLSAARAAETAADDALHLFGGYGYTLEYDAHLYLRFVKAYSVLHRDASLATDLVTTRAAGDELRQAGHAAARRRVADFARRHAGPAVVEAAWASGTLHTADVHAALAAAGLIGVTWPREHGGQELDAVSAGYLWEAFNYHRVPVDLVELTEMVAHVLVHAGSPGQRASVLPRVRAGELLIALGYTEPDAGSDVAAASTRAVRHGQVWRITGAKMFTTGAHVADLIFVLARTDVEEAKHAGLSLFLVPRTAPGVTVSPVHTFGGERTNAVFLDDVEVGEDAVVGTPGEGWRILILALEFERQVMAAYGGQADRLLHDLLQLLARQGQLEAVCEQVAPFVARIEAAQLLAEDVGRRAVATRPIEVAAAMAKLAATEVLKDLASAALDLAGPDGLSCTQPLEHWFRHAQIATIYGGSSEIQRNIIAGRGLRLPRE